MFIIDTTRAAAEDALVTVARHVPADVEIGRPSIAKGGGDDEGLELVTKIGEEAVEWFVWPDRVQRFRESVGGRPELVEWREGVLITRTTGVLQG